MVEIDFYSTENVGSQQVLYVVIVARYQGKWIFVREHDKDSWSLPAGHLESDETIYEAALRELYEETGAVDCELIAVNGYRVIENSKSGYGQFFFAEIHRLAEKPESEIAEWQLYETLPSKLTYPEIQPHFYKRVKQYLGEIAS